jgi:hypothetical protein
MEDSKLTNTEKIERLKQKLTTYKQTLETIKVGSVVDDYLLLKNEDKAIKKQIFTLEDEVKKVKEAQDVQLIGYEKRAEIISDQVESMKESLVKLEDDVKALLNIVNNLNFSDILVKLENVINTHSQPSKTKEFTEFSKLKEEIEQLKNYTKRHEEMMESDKKRTVSKLQPSGYTQLMNMIQAAKTIDSSLPSPRKRGTNQVNPFQSYRQIPPTEVIKIERVRNQQKKKPSTSAKYHITKPSKDIKKNRSKQIVSNALNESIEPTLNAPEVSTTNQKEMQEIGNEQGQKLDRNETELKISEMEQLPSKSEETKQITSDSGVEKKPEERLSFFSFLQRGRNDGK